MKTYSLKDVIGKMDIDPSKARRFLRTVHGKTGKWVFTEDEAIMARVRLLEKFFNK